jgi:homoserine O-acetyltransferase
MSQLNYTKITNYITESGKTTNIQLSYQTFGKSLNDAPIVLVNHALTGNSEVIGKNGWWNDLIGDDKCIDTKDYCILAFNIPGNGFDNSNENLIENYRDYTARDIAKIFSRALEQLNINKLFAAIGGSVGGGIAWELAALKPNLIEHLIPVSTDWKSTDWLIANCHIQDAILNNSSKPLKDARMHAMTLYRTPESFTSKFKRSKRNENLFNTESWLNHHGEKLSNRFNLSAYKLMNQILRTIDITENRGSFLEVASKISSHIHMITINSDLFFKPEENWKTYEELRKIKRNVSVYEVNSIHGHDGFLIEFDQLSNFLNPIFKTKKSNS